MNNIMNIDDKITTNNKKELKKKMTFVKLRIY